MGMFDYIRFELDNPILSITNTNTLYQTKSFDNHMETYVVTQNREIYREEYEYVSTEAPDSILGFEVRTKEEEPSRIYLTDYHGDVIFYTDDMDYVARFTDGKLTRIWVKS